MITSNNPALSQTQGMSSDVSQLLFFPTPYPDEILYSVLCRYHLRCGNPSQRQTNAELWGQNYGKKLYLPDGIEKISHKIPADTGLTAEYFIANHTIFPWLKPFMPKERGEKLFDAMKRGDPDIYSIIGFAKTLNGLPRYLRYCRSCAERDRIQHGESYWHTAHQLPWVFVCPIHGEPLSDSPFQIYDIKDRFVPMPTNDEPCKSGFEVNSKEILAELSHNSLWLLQNGNDLGYLEDTTILYDKWLKVREYRFDSGNTNRKKLAEALVGFYGNELLDALGASKSGTCSWLQ
jgi:hypothetical protein